MAGPSLFQNITEFSIPQFKSLFYLLLSSRTEIWPCFHWRLQVFFTYSKPLHHKSQAFLPQREFYMKITEWTLYCIELMVWDSQALFYQKESLSSDEERNSWSWIFLINANLFVIFIYLFEGAEFLMTPNVHLNENIRIAYVLISIIN